MRMIQVSTRLRQGGRIEVHDISRNKPQDTSSQSECGRSLNNTVYSIESVNSEDSKGLVRSRCSVPSGMLLKVMMGFSSMLTEVQT